MLNALTLAAESSAQAVWMWVLGVAFAISQLIFGALMTALWRKIARNEQLEDRIAEQTEQLVEERIKTTTDGQAALQRQITELARKIDSKDAQILDALKRDRDQDLRLLGEVGKLREMIASNYVTKGDLKDATKQLSTEIASLRREVHTHE